MTYSSVRHGIARSPAVLILFFVIAYIVHLTSCDFIVVIFVNIILIYFIGRRVGTLVIFSCWICDIYCIYYETATSLALGLHLNGCNSQISHCISFGKIRALKLQLCMLVLVNLNGVIFFIIRESKFVSGKQISSTMILYTGMILCMQLCFLSGW
jgi:hypothetical protein